MRPPETPAPVRSLAARTPWGPSLVQGFQAGGFRVALWADRSSGARPPGLLSLLLFWSAAHGRSVCRIVGVWRARRAVLGLADRVARPARRAVLGLPDRVARPAGSAVLGLPDRVARPAGSVVLGVPDRRLHGLPDRRCSVLLDRKRLDCRIESAWPADRGGLGLPDRRCMVCRMGGAWCAGPAVFGLPDRV